MRPLVLRVAAVLLIASAIAVSATNAATRGKVRVRFIHNYATDTVPPSAGAVDVRFGRNPDPAANPVKINGARYGAISDYLRLRRPVTAGVFLAGTTTELFGGTVGNNRNQRFTLVAEQESSASGAFSLQVFDDTTRRSKSGKANVRVIHGIPSATTENVKVGAVGVGCLTGPLSYPDSEVIEVNAGSYTLGVFPASDPDCTGTPIAGLETQARLKTRAVVTAIARRKPNDLNAFELQVVRDF